MNEEVTRSEKRRMITQAATARRRIILGGFVVALFWAGLAVAAVWFGWLSETRAAFVVALAAFLDAYTNKVVLGSRNK